MFVHITAGFTPEFCSGVCELANIKPSCRPLVRYDPRACSFLPCIFCSVHNTRKCGRCLPWYLLHFKVADCCNVDTPSPSPTPPAARALLSVASAQTCIFDVVVSVKCARLFCADFGSCFQFLTPPCRFDFPASPRASMSVFGNSWVPYGSHAWSTPEIATVLCPSTSRAPRKEGDETVFTLSRTSHEQAPMLPVAPAAPVVACSMPMHSYEYQAVRDSDGRFA